MARVADSIPALLTTIMQKVPVSRVIIGDAYMEAGEVSFAHDPVTGKTIYAAQEQAKKDHDEILFGKVKGKKKHPYLEGAILGINCHTLRGDLLQGHRKMLVDVLREQRQGHKSNILWVWGSLDKNVPFQENISQFEQWQEEFENFRLVVQDCMGHELFYEDSKAISETVLEFLSAL